MKKLLFILLTVLISGNVYSQKVSIDKKTGIMSIDKVDVAKFSKTEDADKQLVYTFTDLQSNDYVTLVMVSSLSETVNNFYKVTSSLSDKTSEMENEMLKFTFNPNSVVANLIVGKYKFFTTQGMNKDAIVQFLNLENKQYSLAREERFQKLQEEKQQQAQTQQEIDAKLAPYSPFFNRADLTVINKNTNATIVTLEEPNGSRERSTDYTNFILKNTQGDKLAAIRKRESNFMSVDYYIQTYDNMTFPLDKKETISSINIPLEATKVLIINGYLGNGEKSPEYRRLSAEAKKQAQEEEYKRRAYVNGVLILSNGEEVKGRFNIEFRETPDGMVPNTEENIISLDGKTLTHLYKNEKGKDRGKIYKEKEISSFRVLKEEDPNYDELYCKIEYNSVPASVISADGGLDVFRLGKKLLAKDQKKSALVYRAMDTPKATLYFSGDQIFILDKKNEKTLLLDNGQYRRQLEEIATDCQDMTNNIQSLKYRLNRESMCEFITDYNECK